MLGKDAVLLARAKVIALSVAGAVAYGVLHDEVTTRLCLEYFTVAHPRLIDSDSPTVLGLFWGVVATWWIGLVMGGFLAVLSQPRDRHGKPLEEISRGLIRLLWSMAVMATVAGAAGWQLGHLGMVEIPEAWADAIPENHHAGFVAAWAAHIASYAVGLVGSVVWCVRMWKWAGRPIVLRVAPEGAFAHLRLILVIAASVAVLYWRFRAK